MSPVGRYILENCIEVNGEFVISFSLLRNYPKYFTDDAFWYAKGLGINITLA